jgi:hypothetical protein
MRNAARRFGIGSAVALLVIIATGAAMASHFHLWGDTTLHWKIGLLVVVFILTGSTRRRRTRGPCHWRRSGCRS